jgi:hypothetical protein
MTTLRIYDHQNQVLAVDLRDLIDLLAPRSLEASWIVSPVKMHDPRDNRSFDEFMMTGPGEVGQDQLEQFAASGSAVSGAMLSKAAHEAHQVIWGEFTAILPKQADAWVVIRAIDSSFYEVTSSDESVLSAIRTAFRDVRVASGPATSMPVDPVPRSFQFRLREEALHLLQSKNISAESQSLPIPDPDGGPDDIKVTFGNYELWIYEDGANVIGPLIDKRFEIYDYDDLDHLRQSVLAFLDSLKVS